MIIQEIHRYIEGMIREGGIHSLKAMPEYPLDELREAARAAGMIVNEHDAVVLPFKHHVIWWCDIVRALPHGDMLGVIADFRLIDDSKRDAYRSKRRLLRGHLAHARLEIDDLMKLLG